MSPNTIILFDSDNEPAAVITTTESIEAVKEAIAKTKEIYPNDWTDEDIMENLPEGTTWEYITLDNTIYY